MPVVERVQAVFTAESGLHPIGAQRDPHRQKSAGDSFGKTHQVRHNSREITRKHLSSPAKPGENFVGDQQHVMLRAKLAHPPEKLNRMSDHSPRALQQRFDDYSSDLIAALRQKRLKLL